MKKIISFIRVNKNNKNYSNIQINGIKKYLINNNIELFDNLMIEINLPNEEDNILFLLEKYDNSCTILVYDINVFGRTTSAILDMVHSLLDNGVKIISIKQNFDLVNKDDMLTKVILKVMNATILLEKDLMKLRTKEALAAKKLAGIALGKPKGTIQKSKFDLHREQIEKFLSIGLSVRKISKLLGYNNHIGLNNYIKKRNIKNDLEHKKLLKDM